MISKQTPLLATVALTLSAAACNDDFVPVNPVAPPPDSGCRISETPPQYEVYFVIDVSGSMAPFLTRMKEQLNAFARSFPERDALDRRVAVNYYVVAYVNDVKWFPAQGTDRMTSPIAVQAAISEAVTRGETNQLLTKDLLNAEEDENMLDALAEVIGSNPPPDARTLVLLATDAGFREAPGNLSGGVTVQSTFMGVRNDLEGLGARVYAFTPGPIDGITRTFEGQPALTSIPRSRSYDITDLTSSGGLVEQTLEEIARDATCN